jgi:hypothetical protein
MPGHSKWEERQQHSVLFKKSNLHQLLFFNNTLLTVNEIK